MLACLLVAALLVGLTVAGGASSGPARGGSAQAGLAVRAPAWPGLLGRARDLGPSRAVTARVLAALRTPGRPMALLRWAARHGLRATWFPGQPTVLLAASPAVLGRALGVHVDDFHLAGHGVFYASRQTSQLPVSLRGEVTALGRISSFGQVQPEGVPPQGVPVGGLSPGGFASAYGIRPLWANGDLGAGQTIVFFEVDGY